MRGFLCFISIGMSMNISCELLSPQSVVIEIDRSHFLEHSIRLDRELLTYWNGRQKVVIPIEGLNNPVVKKSLVLPDFLPLVISYTGFVQDIPVLYGTTILTHTLLQTPNDAQYTFTIDYVVGNLGEIIIKLAEQGYAIFRIDLMRFMEKMYDLGDENPVVLAESVITRALITDTMHSRLITPKTYPLPESLYNEVFSGAPWRFFQGQPLRSDTRLSEGFYYLFKETAEHTRDSMIELYVDAQGSYSHVYIVDE